MSQFMYRVLAWITALVVSGGVVRTEAPVGPEISAPSAVLMEASTGQIIYEKNGEEQRSPASITKIMTLILIFDAIDSGKISLSDQVVTSAYAKSMGGSQVFLEEGEMQTVETLIKCIVIASGNDASVAMAEYIAGSEEEFVRQMNERAKGLGMNDTNFEDCCGLTDSPTHVTTAKDIAIMSRELITKYLDGKYHPCDETGYQGVWTFQHEPAAENGHQFPGDRVKDRLYIHSEILPVCHGRKGRDRTDRCGNGGTGL